MAWRDIVKLKNSSLKAKYLRLRVRLLRNREPGKRGYSGRLVREGTKIEEAREYAKKILNKI